MLDTVPSTGTVEIKEESHLKRSSSSYEQGYKINSYNRVHKSLVHTEYAEHVYEGLLVQLGMG